MLRNSRLLLIIISAIILVAGSMAALYYSPQLRGGHINEKPVQTYDYYYIYAEEDGRELMRVPITISVDDELITEDNKRYKIISVQGDKGIARYVEDINIEQYKPKNPRE